jgi:hypothetical protein
MPQVSGMTRWGIPHVSDSDEAGAAPSMTAMAVCCFFAFATWVLENSHTLGLMLLALSVFLASVWIAIQPTK